MQLPALASLGELKDTRPIIIVDSREQTPLVFSRLESRPATLLSGDYSIAGLEERFAVERKTVSDLVGCCMGSDRERFERELHRLRGFKFKRLLVVGSRGEIEMQRYHSRIAPKSVLGSLSAWEIRYDIPVIFSSTREDAAREIERWAWYCAVEQVKTVNGLGVRSIR
jgi:DNA excision repair protein ERCC-4